MPKEQPGYKKLSREELDQLAGEALPERAAMSLINANVAAPVTVTLALNVLSEDPVSESQHDSQFGPEPSPTA